MAAKLSEAIERAIWPTSGTEAAEALPPGGSNDGPEVS